MGFLLLHILSGSLRFSLSTPPGAIHPRHSEGIWPSTCCLSLCEISHASHKLITYRLPRVQKCGSLAASPSMSPSHGCACFLSLAPASCYVAGAFYNPEAPTLMFPSKNVEKERSR
jgi:hypothetical protein